MTNYSFEIVDRGPGRVTWVLVEFVQGHRRVLARGDRDFPSKKRARKAIRRVQSALGSVDLGDTFDDHPCELRKTGFAIATDVLPLVVGSPTSTPTGLAGGATVDQPIALPDTGSPVELPVDQPSPSWPTVELTVAELADPDRVRVSDARGVLATLTVGAQTVVVRGQARTFTEQKRVGGRSIDTFSRTTTQGLGLSPCYGAWSPPIGGTPPDFRCDGSAARITVRSANEEHYCTLRDDDVVDYDIKCTVTTTTAPAGASNSFALIGSYRDTSSHYRFRLILTAAGNVRLLLEKVDDGVITNLSAATPVGEGYHAGQRWSIRAQNLGGVLRAKAWPDGDTEPDGWTHTAEDTSLGEGRVGLRCHTMRAATNEPTFVIDDFEITRGQWAHPPTVSHDAWVRLLPAPFDGAWTPALADRILDWSTDTSPDVLAYGFAFITGAPPLEDPRLGLGKQVRGEARYGQVRGEARYGPSQPNGTRIEGADFNDYIGICWDYRHLAVPTVDSAESAQLHCLDCSGFVRMVFGYHLGIPMSLQDAADLNGLNLPRRSVQIGPYGPGVLIAHGNGAPPALAELQIGDIVAFNADATDDEGTVQVEVSESDDHVGIYVGQDLAGNPLCLSSRKTANGPTMGALGGTSRLDGDGYLAVALRRIRRF